jgi:hypothetical protein
MSYSPYDQPYRQQYKPVTAYTLSVPINVNGTNINNPPYPAINYKPEGVQYPYVYVPIAQFSKVGAKVNWNEMTQTLNVTTDYFALKQFYDSHQVYPSLEARIQMCRDALAASRVAYQEVYSKIPITESVEGKVRYNGNLEDGRPVFDGRWWGGTGENLTVGKYYPAEYDSTAGSAYLIITNDLGEKVNFSKFSIELSI